MPLHLLLRRSRQACSRLALALRRGRGLEARAPSRRSGASLLRHRPPLYRRPRLSDFPLVRSRGQLDWLDLTCPLKESLLSGWCVAVGILVELSRLRRCEFYRRCPKSFGPGPRIVPRAGSASPAGWSCWRSPDLRESSIFFPSASIAGAACWDWCVQS